MPNHKASLKNTKFKKPAFQYNGNWEQEFQKLRNFLEYRRGQSFSSDGGGTSTLEMIKPGNWQFSVGAYSLEKDEEFKLYISNLRPGYGKTPEQAFKNWFQANDNKTLCMGLTNVKQEQISPYRTKVLRVAFKCFELRNGQWNWLPPVYQNCNGYEGR